MLRKMKVDDSGPVGSASALQGHPHLTQTVQSRDQGARFRVLRSVFWS
jgi:hypothetical protein